MKQILRAQAALKQQLDEATVNFKKTGESKRTKGYLSGRISHISNLWADFQKNHLEICTADDDENEEVKLKRETYLKGNQYREFEATYFEFHGELTEFLENKFPSDNSKQTREESQSEKNQIQSEPQAERRVEIKLPRIDLPKFCGDYKSWRSFHDMFVSLIHNDARIPNVQKLHYLKSCLVGEAERIIKQFDMIDSNYETAWQTLIDRYNNKRILVMSQIRALFSQPAVKIESKKGIKDLLDKTKDCLHEINALNFSTKTWDPIIIYLIVQRLPPESHKLWEQEIAKETELPELNKILMFLEARFRTLEAMGETHYQNQSSISRKTSTYHINERGGCVLCKGAHLLQNCSKFQELSPNNKRNIIIKNKVCFKCLQIHERGKCQLTNRCVMCKQPHYLSKCKSFQKLSLEDKRKFLSKENLCLNCLNLHPRIACPSYHGCFKCGKRHHTLLHKNTVDIEDKDFKSTEKSPTRENMNSDVTTMNANETTNCHYNKNQTETLLATSIVKIKSSSGITLSIRALIDLGSQSSFISESAYQALQVKGTPTSLQIAGLGSAKLTTARKEVSFTLQSYASPEFELPTKAYVIKRITSIVPPKYIKNLNLAYIGNIQLADPQFLQAGRIDLLLGVNVYSKIIRNGVIEGKIGEPTAQNTTLGWILFGEISGCDKPKNNSSFSAFVCKEPTLEVLTDQIKRFWECEEISTQRMLTKEERECEEFYEKSHLRKEDGRYQVRLPFKNNNPPTLGNSKGQAFSRYVQLEKKFKQNKEFYKEYAKCLKEYIDLGHMTPTTEERETVEQDIVQNCYYMPHHAVVKESTTTKLRVVFDASARTTNGKNLNEQMLNGPTLQPKLFSTLLKWRKYKYALTADIEKMYRMIEIHPEDRKYQRIFWRDGEKGLIRTYELNTVTFGTTAAPFLAIRTLQQLAHDERDRFPKGSKVALNDFYVDDVLTGADTLEESIEIQNQLSALLKSGGFHLRKWTANHDKLLSNIPEADREIKLPLQFHENSQVKALGIYWHPVTDHFSFSIQLNEYSNPMLSKRNILSEIARLYDPLGWIAPCVVLAKMLMQKLWLLKQDWDEPIPLEVEREWKEFKDEIKCLQELKIPRWVNMHPLHRSCQIHAFCDASIRAYGAAIYIRTVDENNTVKIQLLIAKTKVAPIKAVSLPRLELCGAVLLCRLVKQVKEDMALQHIRSYCWTDSKIVLAWISGDHNKWQTFVANRVGEIQENGANCVWNYIPSKENPADLATRGVSPKNILNSRMWWSGPDWLKNPKTSWHIESLEDNNTTLELKSQKNTLLAEIIDTCDLTLKFSSFEKLLRVTAYCLRFIKNCKGKQRVPGKGLMADELKDARIKILSLVQNESYSDEISQLKSRGSVSRKSQLFKLSPILDNEGIIRVGGRLANSPLSYQAKHPVIMPKNNHVTNLIIEYFHRITLHGGAQLTINTIRINGFWIINGMHAVKAIIFKCIKCVKFRNVPQTQFMGELPQVRVSQARPFQNVGLDYAGPVNLKTSKHRGAKIYKGYICIFVCMAVKAIHIELVSDLTSEAFLAAFRRFTGRRGLCSNIYSDNGSTFIGAEKMLQREFQEAVKATADKTLIEGTRWHFNPPYAPHMGGLWEASVKSIKHHLKRTLQETTLTFEEFTTLLVQIEACVNSRPLNTLCADPTDLEPLTPGHFLIGTTFLSHPEPEALDEKCHIMNRWKYIQQLRQQFWKRWTNEYLTQLQKRQKWYTKQPNIKIGQVVIVKDDKLPPLKWVLGRVEEIHPGNDGRVRVVTLRTKSAVIQRPITKSAHSVYNFAR